MEKLIISDFANLFGVAEEVFSKNLKNKILSFDFSFERPDEITSKKIIGNEV